MNKIEREGRALEQAIAARIRGKRLSLGWTLERLATVTGLSKGYLSQVENSSKTPPISTLTKIAFGLGENVVALISGESPQQEPSKLAIVRKGERKAIAHTEAAPGSDYASLILNAPDRMIDAYVVTVSNEYPEKPFVHGGQELAFCLAGRHEFYYDGVAYRMEEGDAMFFDSDRPHMARSLETPRAKVLVVFCNPNRDG